MQFKLEPNPLKPNSLEDKFKFTFNQAAVGMAHVHPSGRFLLVNSKFCEIINYTKTELLLLDFQDITHPDDLDKDVELAQAVLAGKIQTYTIEKRYICKDASIKWVQLTVSLVRNNHNEPDYYISVIEDIDPRVKMQIELKKSKELLEARVQERTKELRALNSNLKKEVEEKENAKDLIQSFFMLSNDAIVIANWDKKFITVNKTFADMLGYTIEELIGRSAVDFIHPDDTSSSAIAATKNRDTFHLENFENRYISKTGEIIYFSWNATAIKAERLIYAVGRNISSLKAIENELAVERLKMITSSKMNALGRMAADIAHEINNPLTVIYGQTILLKESVESKSINLNSVKPVFEQIERMSNRILNIVNSLRSFMRDGSKDPFKTTSLKDILEETLAFCLGNIQSKGIKLNIPNNLNNVFVVARDVQISQVILNILNNAIDALENIQNPTIQIELIKTDTKAGLVISDNARGIKPELQINLFKPFFTTKEIGSGTGLGLSISKTIIEEHGGTIYYQDNQPCGSRFIFLLKTK